MSYVMKGIFLFIVPLACFSVGQADVFKCHEDLCNVGTESQFCSVAYKYCRDCNTIKDECGTANQPMNCTAYCQELAVENALQEKEKEYELALQEKTQEYEDSCLVTSMLLSLVNGNVTVPTYNGSRVPIGFKLRYACNDGYRLEGVDTYTCTGNDTWNHSTFPHCFDNSWIVSRHAAITLGIISVLLLIIICFCGIHLRRSCKERNDQEMSRTNTDSSLKKEEGQEPLLEEEQSTNYEDETSPMTMGTPSKRTRDYGNDVSTQIPAEPTAPPSDENNENEQPETKERNCPCDHGPKGGQYLTFNCMNNNTNNASEQNGNNSKSDRAEANEPDGSVPPRNDVKSIDVKIGTEESNDKKHEREVDGNGNDDNDATWERPRDKKRRGTKHLPARDSKKQTKDIGPQAAAAKEGSHSSTKETERDDGSAHIGINSVTFSKSDIKGQGQQIEAENHESLESATKESEQDESSSKVGFCKITIQTSDIKMNELKAGI